MSQREREPSLWGEGSQQNSVSWRRGPHASGQVQIRQVLSYACWWSGFHHLPWYLEWGLGRLQVSLIEGSTAPQTNILRVTNYWWDWTQSKLSPMHVSADAKGCSHCHPCPLVSGVWVSAHIVFLWVEIVVMVWHDNPLGFYIYIYMQLMFGRLLSIFWSGPEPLLEEQAWAKRARWNTWDQNRHNWNIALKPALSTLSWKTMQLLNANRNKRDVFSWSVSLSMCWEKMLHVICWSVLSLAMSVDHLTNPICLRPDWGKIFVLIADDAVQSSSAWGHDNERHSWPVGVEEEEI